MLADETWETHLAALELHKVLDPSAQSRVSDSPTHNAERDSPVDQTQRPVIVPLADVARAQEPVLGEDGLVIVQVIALVVTLDD